MLVRAKIYVFSAFLLVLPDSRVKMEVHKLIHATTSETIQKYLDLLQLDKKAIKKVNSLRLSAENLEIVEIAI